MEYTRREAMKGLSLGAVAFQPFLRSLQAEKQRGEQSQPKRFVFVVKASGIDRANLLPPGVKAATDNEAKRNKMLNVSFENLGLPEIFKALEPIKDHVEILQGLSGQNLKGNHTAGYGTLSCHNSERAPVAPTLDYLLGKRFSAGPYPMYAMAMNGTLLGQNTPPGDGYCYPNISAKGKSQAVAFQANPSKAFVELFGSAVMPVAEAKKRLTVKSNLMDFLKNDAKRIEKQLNADERERFANYTEAFESLRVREQKKAGLKSRIKSTAPEFTNKYTSETETVRQACQFDIATAALIIGLTNVVTLRPDTLGTVYSGLGYNAGLHSLGHGGGAGNGWDSPKARKEIDRHHLGLIANMAKKFHSIPEGDGTMLDNTLIVYLSCAGGSHHGGLRDWPVILVGGCGKKLKLGQYLHFPSYQNKGHKAIANVYMSILEAAGVNQDGYFGQMDTQLKDLDIKGPISELLA